MESHFAHRSLNMVKVKGGPKTKEGKAISSQNAVKHGALTKKFQSSEEQEAYNQILSSLQAQFQQPNPLVQMQLERIASLKIQLNRIQHHIDLTYANSQSESEKIEQVCEHLNIAASDLSSSLYHRSDNQNLDEFLKKLEPVIHELISNPWDSFDKAEEFLDFLPNFCNFLSNTASNREIKINTMTTHIESILMSLPFIDENARRLRNILKYHDSDEPSSRGITNLSDDEINEMISEAKIQNLKILAKAILNWLQKLKIDQYNHKTFQKLMESELTPTDVNLDKLDKLYRYQTAVQRQISTVMGELIHMQKIFYSSSDGIKRLS